MNNIYRVIWNSATSNLVVVSEIAKTVAAKSRSVCVSGKRPDAARVGSGYFTLTELATAFCFAGLWLLSKPAMAAGQVGGITVGDGLGISIWPSYSDCTDEATAAKFPTIAIGCGAHAKSIGTRVTDRKNPYDQRDDLGPDKVPTSRGPQAVAIGDFAYAHDASVVVGGRASAAGVVSVSVGAAARVDGASSVALGARAYAKGKTSLAIGRQSVGIGDFAQAIGNVSAAVGAKSLAIGHSATALGERAIAIGSPDAESTVRDIHYHGQSRTLAEGVASISLGTRATTFVIAGRLSPATRVNRPVIFLSAYPRILRRVSLMIRICASDVKTLNDF